MANEREILKVKIDSKSYVPQIKYNRFTEHGVIEPVDHPGNGSAHLDLIQAMNAFADLVYESCRLDSTEWCNATTQVIGISLKDNDAGIGLNITLLGKFEDVAVNINSPFLSAKFLAESSQNISIYIQKLVDECEAYIDGKRAQSDKEQMNLFDQVEAV